jgi:hypothetical protein
MASGAIKINIDMTNYQKDTITALSHGLSDDEQPVAAWTKILDIAI